MPSLISHAVVAVASGISFAPRNVPNHFWILSLICSVIPDADIITFSFGIPYYHLFGHRGFFHSPFFCLLMGIVVVSVFLRNIGFFSRLWFFYLTFFFLLSASHSFLDAFTNGGLGIAILFPFDNARYFFPWRPIVVSPISVASFISRWGLVVIKNEILWVWFPSFLLVIISRVIRVVTVKH